MGRGQVRMAVWMFMLLVPVGFWSLDARRLAMAGVVSASGIALVVSVTRLAAAHWGEILGAVMGLFLGWVLGFLVRPSNHT